MAPRLPVLLLAAICGSCRAGEAPPRALQQQGGQTGGQGAQGGQGGQGGGAGGPGPDGDRLEELKWQAALQPEEQEMLTLHAKLEAGEPCVTNFFLPKLARNVSERVGTIRIALRPNSIWSHRLVSIAHFVLTDWFGLMVEIVPLPDEYVGLGFEALAVANMDLEAPSELPVEERNRMNIGTLGEQDWVMWPGIKASPKLFFTLLAAAPRFLEVEDWEDVDTDVWFRYYKALNSSLILDALEPYNPSTCQRYECDVIPARCAENPGECRMVYQDPDMEGGDRTAKLLEKNGLPYVVVTVDLAWMEAAVRTWATAFPARLLATSQKFTAIHEKKEFRFLFPHSSNTMYDSAEVKEDKDWAMVPVWKVVTQKLLQHMPDTTRWVLSSELMFGTEQLTMVEENEKPAVVHEYGLEWREMIKAAACLATREITLITNRFCASGVCNRPGTFSCQRGFYILTDPLRCAECPAGYYCPDPANSTVELCPDGSSSSPGAHSILECKCKPGFGIVNITMDAGGQMLEPPICKPCHAGLYKHDLSNDHCLGLCPAHSSSQEGATSIVMCACQRDYYVSSIAPWTCSDCPPGADCPGGFSRNISGAGNMNLWAAWGAHEPPRALPGFFGELLQRADATNPSYRVVFHTCPKKDACLGANECSESTTGNRCRACRRGYRRDYANGMDCVKCEGSRSLVMERIFSSMVQPPLLVLLLRMISYASQDSAVLTPVIVKILGLFFLAADTCILATAPDGYAQNRNGGFIQKIAAEVIDYVHAGALRFTTDFTVVDIATCLWSEGQAPNDSMEDEMIMLYKYRMIEVLLAPIAWPLWALLIILPIGYLMSRGSIKDLQERLQALERLQMLAVQGELPLTFSQVMIEDMQLKLMASHSVAGIWRPFSVQSRAFAVAKEDHGSKAHFLRLSSFLQNMASIFMPFWFFHYLSLVKNCMKALFSCNRFAIPNMEAQWFHGWEPGLECFTKDHVEIAGLGGAGVLFYGLGLPLLVCWVVYRKIAKGEEWCWGFNVNGYTFWGWLTVYWDSLLLLRSAVLSWVAAMPSQTFDKQKRIGLLVICACALVLQSYVQPFDTRRNNLLNNLEMRSLYTATLVGPLLVSAAAMGEDNFVVGQRLTLMVFVLLVCRFLFSVVVEFAKEARDALVQFRKQAVFAEMIQWKLAERQMARQKQQKQWLDEMLDGRTGRSKAVQKAKAAAASVQDKDERSSTGSDAALGATKVVKGLGRYLKDLAQQEDLDNEDNDRWSDFSDEVEGFAAGEKKERWNVFRCLVTTGKHLLSAIKWMGWHTLLNGILLVQALLKKLYVISRRHEELQNRYGLVFLDEEASFRFESQAYVLGGLRQREEVVTAFSTYFLCLLKQHRIRRMPIGLPRTFLVDVLNDAAQDKRSLKWRAMGKKTDRMLENLVKGWNSTRQDDEAILGMSQLEAKIHRWLSVDSPSGRLVRVRHLETFLLHVQLTGNQALLQSLLLSSMSQSKPQLATKIVDKEGAKNADQENEQRSWLTRVRQTGDLDAAVMAKQQDDADDDNGVGHDMLISEGLDGSPCPSHLADYWRVVQENVGPEDRSPYLFWDPLLDQAHARVATDRTQGAFYYAQPCPTQPSDSKLTTELKQWERSRAAAPAEEASPWPLHGDAGLRKIIMGCDFLDLRMKHSFLRLPEPRALGILKRLGLQHDMLRSVRTPLAEKVFMMTKQVEECKENARRLQQTDKDFDERLTKEVLDASEALVISMGMGFAEDLMQELQLRLMKSPMVPLWHRTHAKWFEAAASVKSRSFSARWTPWGVPVTTAEETDMLEKFSIYKSDTQKMPQLRSYHAWPLYQMMLRREANLRRAKGGRGLLDEESSNKGPQALLDSIADTPSGSQLDFEDWTGMMEYFKGARGRLFTKQMLMLLEERRHFTLDFCQSMATDFFQSPLLHTTPRGMLYDVQLESYAMGRSLQHVDALADLEVQELEQRRVDLDKCRRAFGLRELNEEMVWCSRGLHDLAPLHKSRAPHENTCDLCDVILGEKRREQTYCCLLCNSIFCAGCSRLAAFLTSGMDEELLQSTPEEGKQQSRIFAALDAIEQQDPIGLLEELKQLEGRLNCTSDISHQQFSCRQVAEWARNRVLTSQSILAMLICKQGRHVTGPMRVMDEKVNCEVCCAPAGKLREGATVCANCDVFLCPQCSVHVQQAEFIRDEVTLFWRERTLDDKTRHLLSQEVKTQPLEVLDVLYHVLELRGSETSKDKIDHEVQIYVHRLVAEPGSEFEWEEEDVEDAEHHHHVHHVHKVAHKAVGPEEHETKVTTSSTGVQVALALSGMNTDPATPLLYQSQQPMNDLKDAFMALTRQRNILQAQAARSNRRTPMRRVTSKSSASMASSR